MFPRIPKFAPFNSAAHVFFLTHGYEYDRLDDGAPLADGYYEPVDGEHVFITENGEVDRLTRDEWISAN